MPEYLAPGVYIEEVNNGPRPIEGVGTAMAAFVGFAPAGPANKLQLITNWSQYVDTFGLSDGNGKRNPHMPGAYLSHSIYGYFNNGGNRCYVMRVVPNKPDTKPPSLALPSKASKGNNSFVLTAADPSAGEVRIEVTPAPEPEANEGAFNLKVVLGKVEEEYKNVMVGRPGKNPNLRPLAEALASSKLITLVEASGVGTPVERMPEPGVYRIEALKTSESIPAKSTHFKGDVNERSGIEGFEVSEEVTMICAPDLMSAYQQKWLDDEGLKAVQIAMIDHCEKMGDRVAILDAPPGLSPQEMLKWRDKSNYDSKFATMYYPWIKVDGPDGKPIDVPPCGHVAGIWARSDNSRGVHKAPANEVVRGALGPVNEVTKGEQDVLNPKHVNCIRTFTGMGVRVWGARTLSSDPAWRYINVRRLFNFVMKSVERGTQWVVFEPNDPDLWARVTRDVSAFLTTVWRDGALFGRTASEAFYVKCDEELNPSEIRDQGKLIIEVGLAPVKPAEFVIFRFSQFSGGGA